MELIFPLFKMKFVQKFGNVTMDLCAGPKNRKNSVCKIQNKVRFAEEFHKNGWNHLPLIRFFLTHELGKFSLSCYEDNISLKEESFEQTYRSNLSFYLNPENNITVSFVLQNAEMSFNFGAQPFKFKPPPGFTPISQAPKELVRNSEVSPGSSGPKILKKINSAPQAIIIEVLVLSLHSFHFSESLLL